MIEFGPQLLKSSMFIWGITELSLPIINVKGRFGEEIKRILFFLFVRFLLFLLIRFFLFLLLFFLLRLLLLFRLLLFLTLFFFLTFFFLFSLSLFSFFCLFFLLLLFGLFMFFLLLLFMNFKLRKHLSGAKPRFSIEITDFLVSEESFKPLNHMRNGGSPFFMEEKS